jgi:hypothetical protein
MDWGVLAGLSDAAKGFGNAWSDKAKADLAERLGREREERAEQRAIAREERQRKIAEGTPSEFKIERDSDGVTWRVPYNKMGQRLGERELASAQDIKDYNFEDDKRRIGLEVLVADSGRKRERHEADMEYREASTDAARARADRTRALPLDGSRSGGRSSSNDDDEIATDTDLANDLIKEYPAIFKDTGLSSQEAYDYALESIRAAGRTGKDPIEVARGAIQRYLDRKRGSTKKSTSTNIR